MGESDRLLVWIETGLAGGNPYPGRRTDIVIGAAFAHHPCPDCRTGSVAAAGNYWCTRGKANLICYLGQHLSDNVYRSMQLG